MKCPECEQEGGHTLTCRLKPPTVGEPQPWDPPWPPPDE